MTLRAALHPAPTVKWAALAAGSRLRLLDFLGFFRLHWGTLCRPLASKSSRPLGCRRGSWREFRRLRCSGGRINQVHGSCCLILHRINRGVVLDICRGFLLVGVNLGLFSLGSEQQAGLNGISSQRPSRARFHIGLGCAIRGAGSRTLTSCKLAELLLATAVKIVSYW